MCNVILRDPLNNLWQLGVTDSGLLTTTELTFKSPNPRPPVLTTNNVFWQLTADTQGRIVSTKLATTPFYSLPYIPMASPGGVNYKLTTTVGGTLQTNSLGGVIGPDVIPYQLDVSMSRWPLSTGVFCTTCGNATVTVSGDLSCWCCSCSSFVLPEDTNIVVILEE